MNLRFSRLLLLVPLACTSVFGFPELGKNTFPTCSQRGDLFGILPLLKSVLSRDLLGDIIKGFETNPALNTAFPGLSEALALVQGDEITPEEYCRALLLAIQGHDVYKQAFEDLDQGLQEKVKRYAAGEDPRKIIKRSSKFYIPPSPAAKHHFKRMEQAGRTASSRAWLNAKRGHSPVIYEDGDKTKTMKVFLIAVRMRGLIIDMNP